MIRNVFISWERSNSVTSMKKLPFGIFEEIFVLSVLTKNCVNYYFLPFTAIFGFNKYNYYFFLILTHRFAVRNENFFLTKITFLCGAFHYWLSGTEASWRSAFPNSLIWRFYPPRKNIQEFRIMLSLVF